MDTYKIEEPYVGWFQVAITDPDGKRAERGGFVSEKAAQKWVDRQIKAAVNRAGAT